MKNAFKLIIKTILGLLALVLTYVVLGLVLPLIPVPKEVTPEPQTIPIYIYTNGVHTDLVVPTENKLMDWRPLIPYKNTKSGTTNMPYLAIGWGDKGFYLDTPEWADLKFSTAVEAAFWLGESAMHCTYYPEMKEGEDCKKIMLSESQYLKLVQFISDKFERDSQNHFIPIPTDAIYGDNDAFYEGKGSYSFLETCNTWANDGLKACGQRAALWTPTDFGIFWHYK